MTTRTSRWVAVALLAAAATPARAFVWQGFVGLTYSREDFYEPRVTTPQLDIDRRHCTYRPSFAGGDWPNIIVEVSNPDPAIVVPHAGDEVGNQSTRIRCPVSIMSAVQWTSRSVKGDIESRHAADAQLYLLPATLMIRPVTEDPGICAQYVSMPFQHVLEMR